MILDTSTWIEFFQGSEKGKKVWTYLKSNKCHTSIITLSEITSFCIRNKLDYINRINRIKLHSQIIPINEEICILAGKLSSNKNKLGMVDSIIYSTALMYKLTLLTKDKDFTGMENVEIL